MRIKRLLLLWSLFCLGVSFPAMAQDKINGRILGTRSEPLSGATVTLKGTSTTATTDANGNFTIAAPAGGTLLISFVGYTDKEVKIDGRPLNISLEPIDSRLNDVVVIGYQTVKRKDLTGAVDVVKVADARKVVAATMGEALQGLATGVNVRASGRAGSEPVIEIRGNGSLINNNPTYVIDGQPLTQANRDFNPADIETIQILKDASAAAIYGSRAANGVIIITTRHGKEGPMKVNFTARYGGENIKRWDLAGPQEWIALNKQAYDNSGTPYMKGVATYGQPGNTASTDWQKEVMRTGRIQDYNLGISGGSNSGSYYVSGSYFKNTGSVLNSGFERETMRVNTEAKRGIFKVGENMILSNTYENFVQGNPLLDMLTMLPIMPVHDSTNLGGFMTGNNDYFTSGENPIAINSLFNGWGDNFRIKGNAYAEIKPLSWISYRFNVGAETNWGHTRQFNVPGRVSKDVQNNVAAMIESRDNAWDIITEHTINFDHNFGKHHIDGVAGFNFQQDYYSNILSNGTDFQPIGTGTSYPEVLTAASSTYSSGNISKWTARSFFGRLNYNFDNRYLLSGTVRRESDSRFGTGYKNATFPAVSAAWNLTNEKFADWKNINLKLRGSYGSLGNVTVAPWQYLGVANSTIRMMFSGSSPLVAATQTDLANSDLRWETNNTTDIGVDGGVLNNRITFTVDYFRRISKNVLTTNDPLPAYLTGNSNPPYPAVNAASLKNVGFEASVTYRDNDHPLKWDVTLNFTRVRNTLLKLGETNGTNYVQEALTRSQIGRSLGEYYLLQSDGIFQNQGDIDSYTDKNGNKIQPTAMPGNMKFIQHKTNGVQGITSDDRVFRGSPWPTFQTGMVINLAYRGFSLNMIWFGSFGNKLYNGTRSMLQNLQSNNAWLHGLTPWTPQNHSTSTPIAWFGSGVNSSADASLDVININDRWLESGSFVRLRNIELAYSLPGTFARSIHAESCRFYLSGQNLLTFTKYTGLDPEIANGDIFSRGVDYQSYPANRMLSVGVQLGF